MKIESLDVLKAQEQLDLQEATRRDDVYKDINKIVDSINVLPVFPSLVWTWTWDIIRSFYDNNLWADMDEKDYEYECIAEGLELKTIWDKFWEDSDKNGFGLEYGAEVLEEAVIEWMRDCNFIVSLDNDSLLDSDDEEDDGSFQMDGALVSEEK
jgi:hypothetical protein